MLHFMITKKVYFVCYFFTKVVCTHISGDMNNFTVYYSYTQQSLTIKIK